jgi:hypothetical protein
MARQQKTSNTQNLAWVVWTGGMVDGTLPEASMVSSSGLDGNLVRDGIAGGCSIVSMCQWQIQ